MGRIQWHVSRNPRTRSTARVLDSGTQIILGMESAILYCLILLSLPHLCVVVFSVYLLNSSLSFSFTMHIVENQYSHIEQCALGPWVYIIISLKLTGIFESELKIPKERESVWPSFVVRGLDKTQGSCGVSDYEK